jgi:hypothetical protein
MPWQDHTKLNFAFGDVDTEAIPGYGRCKSVKAIPSLGS